MNGTLHYSIIQGLYWASYCLMFNYAATYLQDKGFSASGTGLILGACYALSALLQPVFASFVEKRRLNPARAIGCIYAAVAIASLALLLPVGIVPMVVLFVTALTLQNAMQSSVNALAHSMDRDANGVNFSLARGIGSATFSLVAFGTGFLLKKMSCRYLPLIYGAAALVMFFFSFAAQKRVTIVAVREENGAGSVADLLKCRTFVIFLAGIVLIMTAHMFLDFFMLNIMQNVGGGSAELGTALAIASITELPAMFIYSRLRKRFSCASLIIFCACAWVVKQTLTIFAPTPGVVYVCQMLQCASYAVYVPAGVEFVGIVLPENLYMQGQAFLGAAFALGCLPATLLGGKLLDSVGLKSTLITFAVLLSVGAALFIVAAVRSRKTVQ